MGAWSKAKVRIASIDGNGKIVELEVHESGLFALHKPCHYRNTYLIHCQTGMRLMPSHQVGLYNHLNRSKLKSIAEILVKRPKLWSGCKFNLQPTWTKRQKELRLKLLKAAIKTVKGETP